MLGQSNVINPLIKNFEANNFLMNNVNTDSTGLKNPLNSNFNQDINFGNLNNNLNTINLFNNPMIPMMNFNDNTNLYNFFSEFGKVVLKLEQDLYKVISEISQLNLLISNIKMKICSSQNLNNINMINNDPMINKMMNNNNMLNINNFNNDMSNSISSNNNINKNNNINMINSGTFSNNMMDNNNNNKKNNLININQFSKIDDEEIYVIFIKEETKTRFKCKRNEKVNDIIEKYREEAFDDDTNIEFIYNGKELNKLNKNLTASEAGISNNSNIYVVTSKKLSYDD